MLGIYLILFVCLFVLLCFAIFVFVLFWFLIYFCLFLLLLLLLLFCFVLLFFTVVVVAFVFVLFRVCCCCFYVFFCFSFWTFGLSCSLFRHLPSVFHFFLRIAVASYKHCVNILAGYTSVLGIIGWVVENLFT